MKQRIPGVCRHGRLFGISNDPRVGHTDRFHLKNVQFAIHDTKQKYVKEKIVTVLGLEPLQSFGTGAAHIDEVKTQEKKNKCVKPQIQNAALE